VKSLGAFIEPSALLGLWDHPAGLQAQQFIWGCILPETSFIEPSTLPRLDCGIVGSSRVFPTTTRAVHLAWIVKFSGVLIEPPASLGLWEDRAGLQPQFESFTSLGSWNRWERSSSRLTYLDCGIILPTCNHTILFGGAFCRRLCSTSHPPCLAWIVGSSCRHTATTQAIHLSWIVKFSEAFIEPSTLLGLLGVLGKPQQFISGWFWPCSNRGIVGSVHWAFRLAWIVRSLAQNTTIYSGVLLASLGLWDHQDLSYGRQPDLDHCVRVPSSGLTLLCRSHWDHNTLQWLFYLFERNYTELIHHWLLTSSLWHMELVQLALFML